MRIFLICEYNIAENVGYHGCILCFFMYFKQHLLKAFFDKIKTDHRKWLFVAEKPAYVIIQVIFLFKICRYWYKKKIGFAQPNSTLQTVCKNIQKHAICRIIKVEKIREITKSMFFSLSKYFKNQKHSYQRFSYHKEPFAIVNFDFSEKCFL